MLQSSPVHEIESPVKTSLSATSPTRVTRLRRGVSVNSDSTTVRIGDPEAQNAIRAALRELDKIEGSQAAAKALRDMLENAEAPTTEAAKKEIRRRSSQVISVTG